MNTEIIVLTDRSGSMTTICQDAIGGFAAFIEEQKKMSGDVRITQIMFDDQIETQYQALPLDQTPELTLEPRGMTALLDAIGTALNVQGKRIHDEDWADLVIVVIITDGGENASREYTASQIKEMISHAEKHNWKFVFLAANQDAFQTGAQYGISAQFTSNFDATPSGTRTAYAAMSASVSNLRAGLNQVPDL